jgi:hypothetical protein
LSFLKNGFVFQNMVPLISLFIWDNSAEIFLLHLRKKLLKLGKHMKCVNYSFRFLNLKIVLHKQWLVRRIYWGFSLLDDIRNYVEKRVHHLSPKCAEIMFFRNFGSHLKIHTYLWPGSPIPISVFESVWRLSTTSSTKTMKSICMELYHSATLFFLVRTLVFASLVRFNSRFKEEPRWSKLKWRMSEI